MESFFVIGPLGFEESFQNEIARLQPWILGSDSRPTDQLIKVENVRKGGLEISAPKLEAFQLVHHLKTPVRILWRWKSKNLSHVAELKSWVRGLRPLDIVPGAMSLKISSRKSRLNNEKMIERVFLEERKFIVEGAENTLFVDVFEDQFTLSWDMCGEPLYKRSWTPLKGLAPIRENLARLLLEDLVQGFSGPELSQMNLVDPMMGSGTFLWECLNWTKPNLNRSFAYQSWKGLPGLLKAKWWLNLNQPENSLFKSYWGFDSDSQVVKEIALKNAEAFPKADLHLHAQNVLEKPKITAPPNTLMISNPPYGERLSTNSTEKLMEAALEQHKPLKALFVWPEGKIPEFSHYKASQVRQFLQGGIPVQVVVFSRIAENS